MNTDSLVEEITRLVMEELAKAGGVTSSGLSSVSPHRVLVVLDEEVEELEPLFEILGKTTGVNGEFHMVIPEGLTERVKQFTLPFSYIPITSLKRSSYKGLVSAMDKIIVPFLTVTGLSKIAGLIGDEAVPGLCIAALSQGKPVVLCTDHIHSMQYSSLGTESKFMSIIRQKLELVKELGVETVQLNSLTEKITSKEMVKTPLASETKAVVTKEDILIAGEQQKKSLHFPAGSIITPLAKETASDMGIEIHLV